MSKKPELVTVPAGKFLMVDGHGNPETSTGEAIPALYTAAYRIKFALKKRGIASKVSPLEGLWWMPDMNEFSVDRKSDWDWTLMIRVPDEVDATLLEEVEADPQIRLETFDEGSAAQILHVGPYSAEGPTIERLHAFIAEQGLERAGRHHEIYLGDPRRAAPEKLKTLLRQPVLPR